MGVTRRANAESRVESVKFKAVDEIENRRGFLADEREEIDGEGGNRQDETDRER